MGRAKEIIVKVIPAKIANEFVKKWHYSGKVVNNSKLHFGCFLDNYLHGVMSFGSPLDKSKVLPLVQPSLWNEMLELNRLAFDDYLPKNSESRCLSIAIKQIKKNAPHIKWILSFSDGCQSGDGTIYRATGFNLTAIKTNKAILELPDGYKFSGVSFAAQGKKGGEKVRNEVKKRISQFTITKGSYIKNNGSTSLKPLLDIGAKWIDGFQLRYIYLIDKSCKITVPILPFSKIDEMGAGMYKGQKITQAERHKPAAVPHLGEGLTSSQKGAFDATVPLNNISEYVTS
jgi:hypothetical protein